MTNVPRRGFLRLAAALAAAGCSDPHAPGGRIKLPRSRGAVPAPDGGAATEPPRVELDALPLEEDDFSLGIMSGDATPTQVVLWTRYTGSGSLGVQVESLAAKDGAAPSLLGSRRLLEGEITDGGFVHLDLKGLQPGTRYRYAFYVIDRDAAIARGPFGYFRTALAPDAMEVVTFGGTSCTALTGAPYRALTHAAAQRFDFFLHGGDHVYCDEGTDAITLAEYRSKYSAVWATAGMAALHASSGMVLTWDDHEVANNWDPETFPSSRLAAARKAFFEHRALRRDPAFPDRVWRSLSWGKTLDLFILDARSERRPSTRNTPNAQYISPAQLAWLEEGLSASTAVFKLILNSVPITDFPNDVVSEANKDKWVGYPAQRSRILDFVVNKSIEGVWWLSGDLHFGTVGRIATSGPHLAMREVLMGPSGTAADSPDLPTNRFDTVINERNYTRFVADPFKRELTIEFVSTAGRSIFKRTYPA